MVLADIIKTIVDPFKHHFQVGNIKYNYSVAKKGINSILIQRNASSLTVSSLATQVSCHPFSSSWIKPHAMVPNSTHTPHKCVSWKYLPIVKRRLQMVLKSPPQ